MIAVNRVQRSLKVSLEIQKLQVSVLILIGEATAMLESDTIQGKQGSSYIGTESQIHHLSESGCISFIHYSFLFDSLTSVAKLGFCSEFESTF